MSIPPTRRNDGMSIKSTKLPQVKLKAIRIKRIIDGLKGENVDIDVVVFAESYKVLDFEVNEREVITSSLLSPDDINYIFTDDGFHKFENTLYQLGHNHKACKEYNQSSIYLVSKQFAFCFLIHQIITAHKYPPHKSSCRFCL